MKSSEVREKFLSYFEGKDHHRVNSSPLVPGNDPTLLFTNAGMVQFKETFLGLEPRPYSCATTSQRCVRAGGKHNDLENVGYTARHHTFFEMLGNFSFGDYFKREAITYAWEFLTQELKLPEERLWVTVYQEDDEAADIWLNELKVSKERFSRCGEKDNFWSMGDTGPCGPCTEIFYDHGEAIAGGPPGTPEEDGDRYVEIWNLVFMQYNRDETGTLTPLPKPSVDTGMGLERIAAVMQGVHSNYDIDLFQHLISAIHQFAPQSDKSSPSLKVIADHIRACSFLIIDGVLPGNEGRGYVLRRIIRRAIRHGNKLGINENFFYRLVAALSKVMGQAYPELVSMKDYIERVLKLEEEQFSRTLEHGLKLLNQQLEGISSSILPGELVFKLYDTYGFPVDLTADIAREHGLNVDMVGFEQAMEKQRAMSQASSHFKADFEQGSNIREKTEFCGYDNEQSTSPVLNLLCDNTSVEMLKFGQKACVILENTPFYAESGGQVGDVGQIMGENGLFVVTDTQKSGDAIVHIGEMLEGVIKVGDAVKAKIDSRRRHSVALNHSATHLLHAALKHVIGAHVQQKGSLVEANRARFDFSHHQGLALEQLSAVEDLVNEQIRRNLLVETELMTPESAQESGAVALFGEKYGDTVRVLTMGDFSKELCGGTHVKRTGDIGLFKIIAESGIASGVRRIEMVTGAHAIAWIKEQIDLLNELTVKLKTDKANVSEKLSQFLHESKQLEKENEKLSNKLLAKANDDFLQQVKEVAGVKLLVIKLEGVEPKTLRDRLDQLKSKLDRAVIVIAAVNDNKLSVIAGISKQLVGYVPSAKVYVEHLCGRGGGREDMAQGGGSVSDDFEERLKTIESLILTHCEQ